MLYHEGIPYRYEYPLYLNGYGKVYPDFCVLNVRKRKELYWEHFGMMDNPEYLEHAIRKIETYEKNGFHPGINLIFTYETSELPINTKIIREKINKFLK